MTRLSLTDQLLCSASLDFTARLWKRGTELRCAAVLHLRDWVWDIVARCVRADDTSTSHHPLRCRQREMMLGMHMMDPSLQTRTRAQQGLRVCAEASIC